MTFPIETSLSGIVLDEHDAAEVAWLSRYADSLGTESSFSTSSASSQPAARSGTSSRSLQSLARSSLVAYLPALRASALVQSLTRLSLGIGEDDKDGTST